MESFAKPTAEIRPIDVAAATTAGQGLALDSKGAIPEEVRAVKTGLAAARPTATIPITGLFWFATDTGALSYCTGTAWTAVGNSTGEQEVTISAANTDLAAPSYGISYWLGRVGGGTLRRIGEPSSLGSRIVLRNSSVTAFSIINNSGNSGSNIGIFLDVFDSSNLVLQAGDAVELSYQSADGKYWVLTNSWFKPRVQTGTLVTSSMANDSNEETTVTFPYAFASAPIVTVSIYECTSGALTWAGQTCWARSVTNTNFVLGVWNVPNANATRVQWHAIL